MKQFLLEIGCEELPARFIRPAKEGIAKLIDDALSASRIGHGETRLFGAPRRIAVLIDGVEEKQRETTTVKFGPPAARAFDAEGKLTPAAIGFAKSQGVDVSELLVRKKENAELICVEKREIGKETKGVLAEILAEAIGRTPFQKRMRWGEGTFEFGRPIHWVVALLGDEIIRFEVAGIESGNKSKGHRFLSPGDVEITEPGQYLDVMRKAYIVADEEERSAMMKEVIRSMEAKTGARAVIDPDLMEEIQYITEYPYGLLGSFEEEYLRLPASVLVNVMKGHQRYVPLMGKEGPLISRFIFFANTKPSTPTEVIRGNERVLRARLADGAFFFEEDKKVPLDSLYEKLGAVMFHKRLGNLKDKSERVALIALHLATTLGLPIEEKVGRAARMIKADLLTHMVGEFPELQGTMGRIYAEVQGADKDIARSIEEHYYPKGTEGALPESDLGSIMALADKLDSLVAFFSVGITPTGNLDPFGLRRQAIGSIRIIIDKAFHISLSEVFERGYHALSTAEGKVPLDTIRETLSEFVATRFKFLLIEEGRNQEFVNAVLPYAAIDIYDGFLRLRALETQKSIEDFTRLMVGFKRVYNITKSLKGDGAVLPALFEHEEERDLYELHETRKDIYLEEIGARRYGEAISVLVGFKETIDRYFDKVFVMVDDENVKKNRLSLLSRIKEMFLLFGDFSKIRVEELS